MNLTIATPFSGKTYCLDEWLEAFDAIRVDPSTVSVVWLDNSQDAAFGMQLAEARDQRKDRFASFTIVTDATKTVKPNGEPDKDGTVARSYRLLRGNIATAWVLFLEDDVFPPADVLDRLYPQVAHIDEIGAISAAVPYHHFDSDHIGIMAWEFLRRHDPLPDVRRKSQARVTPRYRVPCPITGTTAIEGTGFACLLLRRTALNETEIASDMDARLGFDQRFSIKLRERGWRLMIDWGVRCEHHQQFPDGRTELVQVPLPVEVDVIIPCTREYARWLPEALDSVARQTYPAKMVVVVSWGEGSESVRETVSSFKGVEFVTLPEGAKGNLISAARNFGAAHGKGKFIVFLDADDLLPSLYVEESLKVLENAPTAGYVSGHVEEFGESDSFYPATPAPPHRVLECSVSPCTAMMRRKSFDLVGGFPADFDDEVWAMAVALYEVGWYPALGINVPPVHVRKHIGSASGRLDADADGKKLRARYWKAFERPHTEFFVVVCNANPVTDGGDSVQLVQTREALWKRGIGTDYRDEIHCDIAGYPLAHIFHINAPWSLTFAEKAKDKGIPYVVSSIYHKRGGDRLLPIADGAEKIICASAGERKALLEDLGRFEDKMVIVRHGVHPLFRSPLVSPPVGLPSNYLLCVGRFESNKNQLSLLKALVGLDIPVVFVGGPDHAGSDGYLNECRAFGYPHATFLPSLTYEEMPGLYRGAYAVACVSWHESFALSLLEGQAAGCNLVISTGSLAHGDFAEFGTLCMPNSVDSIREAVIREMSLPRSEKPPVLIWTQVGESLAALYRDIVDPT